MKFYNLINIRRFYMLKQTPGQLALEAPITQFLHTQFQGPVPKVIAYHAPLNCFLMQDAGYAISETWKA
jgi:hypothetical protein